MKLYLPCVLLWYGEVGSEMNLGEPRTMVRTRGPEKAGFPRPAAVSEAGSGLDAASEASSPQ